MLINLLGGDGVGKTTLISYLKEYIEQNYLYKFVMIDKWQVIDNRESCPGLNFIKKPTFDLKDSLANLSSINRFMFLTLLYSCSIEKVMHDIQDENVICVADGLWYKHLFSELAIGADKEWMDSIIYKFPRPDLSIIVDCAPEVAFDRKGGVVTRCECGTNHIVAKESFVYHQSKMSQYMLDFAHNNNYPIINGNKALNFVFKELKHIIDTYFRFRN